MLTLLWTDWPERGQGMAWGVDDDVLDEAILGELRAGRGTLYAVRCALKELWPEAPHGVLQYRATGRLQWLRVHGRIRFDLHHKIWKECDACPK
jgi:hypothetical protein